MIRSGLLHLNQCSLPTFVKIHVADPFFFRYLRDRLVVRWKHFLQNRFFPFSRATHFLLSPPTLNDY